MKFASLSSPQKQVSFERALHEGLAPDGSLYMPVRIPTFSSKELEEMQEKSYSEVAYRTVQKWLENDISATELQKICEQAFSFEVPIVKVGPYQVLELFHGPTMAFKDIAARFL